MNNKPNEIRDKILKGLEISSKKLIQYKKSRNLDLVISKDGKVVRINPNDIV